MISLIFLKGVIPYSHGNFEEITLLDLHGFHQIHIQLGHHPSHNNNIYKGEGLEGKQMKIGIVTEYYYPHLGGITENVHNFSIYAMRMGCSVTVITSHTKGEERISAPFEIIRIGRSFPIYGNDSIGRITLGIDLGKKLKRIFEEKKFHILHIHSPLTPTLPIISLRYANCPKVGTFHTYFESSRGYRLWNKYVQRMMDSLDGRIAVSKSCIDSLERYFRIPEYEIIPNGVNTEIFRKMNVKREGKVILFIGRFDPRNNLHLVIQAFISIKKEVPSAKLYIIGYGYGESYYTGLVPESMRRDVIFLGGMNEERPYYYNLADVLCYPVDKASFGITLLEAMACGIPMVLSDITGFRHIVTNGKEALLVKPDVHEIKSAIVKILKDDALRKEMSESCLRKAREYSWESITKRILDYYERILLRKGIAVKG